MGVLRLKLILMTLYMWVGLLPLAQRGFCNEVEFLTPVDLVQKTSAKILKKLGHMKLGITNETELRYCVGDPILEAICNAWGYKARLEESIKSQKDHELLVSVFFLSLRILLFCFLMPLFVVCYYWGTPEWAPTSPQSPVYCNFLIIGYLVPRPNNV